MGLISLAYLFLVLFIVLSVLFVLLLIVPLSSVPWVPTDRSIARGMFKLAQLRPGEVVVDFGCGDAGLLITAAKDFKARGVGFEINPFLVVWARVRVLVDGVSDQIKIHQGNFYTLIMPPADLVVCYLFPEAQTKLESRLVAAYPSGTRVVSHAFAYPNLRLIRQDIVNGATLYLYQIP